MVMSRDGLLPPVFGRIHPKFRTPVFSTILCGVVVAIAPSIITGDQALELTSIGTLFAFFLVSGGVIALRHVEPTRHRPFKVPGYPVTPILSMATCVFLMTNLPATNWWRLAIWLAVGMVVYLAYSRSRSRMVAKAT